LKARQDFGGENNSPASSTPSQPRHDGLPPLFDATIDLPAKELLPSLLENFYEYYADTYFFLLNRKQSESLIEQGEASAFLVCVIRRSLHTVIPKSRWVQPARVGACIAVLGEK